jgi:hypothetical protein
MAEDAGPVGGKLADQVGITVIAHMEEIEVTGLPPKMAGVIPKAGQKAITVARHPARADTA